MIDTPQEPSHAEDTGGERRRAYRHPFSTTCFLSIRSPAWAITKEPFKGASENITIHGMRLVGVHIDGEMARHLDGSVREDIDIKVETQFEVLPDFPPLKGSIVWVDRRQEIEGTVSFGILFDVPTEQERQALESLVLSLQKR